MTPECCTGVCCSRPWRCWPGPRSWPSPRPAAAFAGEGWQLDAWQLEPKRRLIARFVEGWIASAPFALGVALVALIDHLLLVRWRQTRFLAGALLPIAGAAVALILWPVPMDALPVLAGTGLVLAAVSRSAHFVYRRLR